MKRAPWYVAAGAAAGFATVIGIHGHPASSARPLAQAPQSGTGARHAGAGNGSGTGSSRAAGPSAAPSAAPSASPAPAGPARTASGTMEQYGYGELSVKVTVKGTRITNISVPVLRTAEPYSQQLADQVIPMLKSEVLSAQSASINGVTGATYTCEAYAASLQAALDKLHIK